MNSIGHSRQWDFFSRVFREGRFANAYIFAGAAQVGKRTFARKLASLLLCERPGRDENKNAEPCTTCVSCRHTAHASHPDFYEVSPSAQGDSRFNKGAIALKKIQEVRSFVEP